jgi:hypothetical protein
MKFFIPLAWVVPSTFSPTVALKPRSAPVTGAPRAERRYPVTPDVPVTVKPRTPNPVPALSARTAAGAKVALSILSS